MYMYVYVYIHLYKCAYTYMCVWLYSHVISLYVRLYNQGFILDKLEINCCEELTNKGDGCVRMWYKPGKLGICVYFTNRWRNSRKQQWDMADMATMPKKMDISTVWSFSFQSTYTIENPDIRHRWMLQRFSESLGPCQEPLAQGPFLSIRTDCVCRSWNGDRRWRQQVLQKRIFRKTKWCKTTLFLQSGRKILGIWDMTNHLPSYLILQPTHVCLWSKYNSVFKVCPNSGQMKHGFQAASPPVAICWLG